MEKLGVNVIETDALSGTKRDSTLELRLIPYARAADQEFAKKHTAYGDTKWEISTGWSETTCRFESISDKKGDWVNSISLVEAKEKFGDFISLRQDTNKYGFVINKRSRVVFLADTKSLNALKSIAGVSFAEIQEKHPEVIEALSA